jgi:cytochrome c
LTRVNACGPHGDRLDAVKRLFRVWCVVQVLVGATMSAGATPAEYAKQMEQLATERGCMACHTLVPAPKRADGLPPIAPAWRDIALKYRDDPGAAQRLKRIVMTGSDPKSRHWSGKVSEANMPPNAGVVTEREARALVDWLLVLVP